MPRAGDTTINPDGGTLGGRAAVEGRHVCPFCGAVNETMEGPCPQCTMTNTAESRKATKSRIGPWYVLQSRNPAAPGMRYETLLGFVRKGRVKARSIVRGPTTHQLWRFACQVKGLSREFSLCYSCGGSIEADAQLCPQCNRLQDPPADPDVFLEGQGTPATPVPEVFPPAPAPAARPVAPADAWQETQPGPIFKELKLPPLGDQSQSVPAPAPVTPAPWPPLDLTPPPPSALDAALGMAASAAPAPSTRVDGPGADDGRVQAPREEPPRVEPRGPAPPAMPPAPPPAGDGPRKRNANDVFLSAKDLAAAFQLGFDGDGDGAADARPRRGSDADAPWERDSAPAPRPAHRRPRRNRRVGRTILVLLLLCIGGAVAYLAVDAAARQRVFAWAEAKYMGMTGADLHPDLTRPRVGGEPATPPAPSDSGDPGDATAAASVVPSRTSVPSAEMPPGPARSPIATVMTPRTLPTTGRSAPVVAPPASRPAMTTDAATRPPPGLAAGAGAQSRPSPRPQSDARAAVATQPVSPARPSLEDSRRKSNELWVAALDAEESGDYRRAKSLYEQMKTLPREVWYQGIEERLRFANERLGEK